MTDWSMIPDSRPNVKLGWRNDQESTEWLDSLDEGTPFTVGDYAPMPKDVVRPSSWLRIEDQNGFGSCQGHALSSCAEIAYWLASGGKVIQLSRWMAYVGTQIIDGIHGDNGSTISGGAELAKTRGICPEDAYPYPRRYTRQITREQYEAAGPYRLYKFNRMRSWEDCRDWLDGGIGPISIGVRWGNGGHAICITETLPNQEGVKVANSWGPRWGDHGWFEWTAKELDRKLDDRYTVAIGMTDMHVIKPREDWSMF